MTYTNTLNGLSCVESRHCIKVMYHLPLDGRIRGDEGRLHLATLVCCVICMVHCRFNLTSKGQILRLDFLGYNCYMYCCHLRDHATYTIIRTAKVYLLTDQRLLFVFYHTQ